MYQQKKKETKTNKERLSSSVIEHLILSQFILPYYDN